MNNEQKNEILFDKQRRIIENRFSKLFLNKEPKSLYVPSIYMLQCGGKRIRPLLLLFSKKAVSGSINGAYNAAIAVELLHNFTLVHDDIMDNSIKRRGRPTVHTKYDLSTAILTGDNLLAIAYSYLLKDCRKNTTQVVDTFTHGVIEVCEGQSLDKEFEGLDVVSIKEYLNMINKKTAALLSTCCSIGAQLGGGSHNQVKALSNYGKYLGMAFQIQDDLLDIIGDETEFGKSIGGDIVEGKKTFLFLKALERAKGKDLKDLKTVIRNKGISRNLVGKYKNLYIELDIINEAKKKINQYTSKALQELEQISSSEDKNILTWIANSLIKRNK